MTPIHILRVTYAGGLSVLVDFSDGKSQTVDVGEFIRKHPHPQYDRYAQPVNFKKFSLRNGNLIWGKHVDLMFPVEALYRNNLDLTDDEAYEALYNTGMACEDCAEYKSK